MLPKLNFKIPLLQFIKAFEVARNGLPRITGAWKEEGDVNAHQELQSLLDKRTYPLELGHPL